MSDTHSEKPEGKKEQVSLKSPEVTPYAKPTVQPWHLLVMNRIDATYLLDSSGKTHYKHGLYLVMNPADAANIT